MWPDIWELSMQAFLLLQRIILLAAFLRALGDSKSPLYFLIISAGINVVLDVVLIRFAGMGVEGCAYATVIAQGVSAICCLVYIKKKYPILHLEKKNFELQRAV